MQGLSPTQKRVLTPVCPPGPIRLVTFVLMSGFAVALLDRGLSIPDTLALMGAVTLCTLALIGSTAQTAAAVLTRAGAAVARHVLARATVAS